MKIKSSLFLLLAALLAPWAANAQDNTIVLNDYKNIAIQSGQTYNFYDSGGSEDNYGYGEEYTLTLICNGDITINFSQFETRPSSNCLEIGGLTDYMLIYDGVASEDNLLMRGQTGCPSSLVTGTDYVAMSGTMTIEWKSSMSGSYQGWQATIIGGTPNCSPIVIGENNVYTEGFEGYLGTEYNANGVVPRCWDSYTSNGNVPAPHIISKGDYYVCHDGIKSLFFNCAGYSYAALPRFANPLSDLRVSFWMQNQIANHGELVLGYIKEEDENYNTFTPIETYASNQGSMVQRTTMDLTRVPADAYRLAFRCYDTEPSGCYIDDIEVSLSPYRAPTGLQVSNITTSGATFAWDAVEGVPSYQYFTVANPAEGFEPTGETVWSDVPNNSVTLTNVFTPNSLVRFYVRKNFGNGSYGKYTYMDFRTGCGPVVVNSNSVYTENFDSYTSHTNNASSPNTYPNDPLPQCWQFINRSDGSYPPYPKAFLTSSPYYAVSGNCLLLNSSGVKDLYAILPQFAGNISGYQLTFTYRNEGTTDDNGTLYVGYMTNPNDTTTFVQTLECHKRAALTTKAAFFLQAPQGSYIAFKYGGGAYNYNLSIDDVVVSVVPSCFPTGTPTCDELSAHTAKLSWDLVDATQTAWEVEYSTSIEFAGSLTVDATTHEDFELTGLDAETQYYARVRAKCGNDDYSTWSEAASFTTFNTCPVPFNLAVNNLTAGKADLSWTGSIDVSSYDVRYRSTNYVIGDYERFNTTSAPEGWELKYGLLSQIMDGQTLAPPIYYMGYFPWGFGAYADVFDSHARLCVTDVSSRDWLISKSYTIQSSDAVVFDLAMADWGFTMEPDGTDDRFVVLITTDNCQSWTILREWNNTGSEYVFNNIACSATGERVAIDLSGYAGQTVRIAFYGESTVENARNYLHIDNVAVGTLVAASPWETKQGVTANTATVTEVLRNLSAETEYEAQVKSNCSNPEVWTAPLFFKTLEAPDAPTGLQVVEGSITATGASFSWNGEPNESFQYFTVTNPQEGFEPTEATVWTNVQGNTVNVTDAFTPNRVARFYLRKDCGDDGLSKYTYVEFRTGCGTVVIDDNNSYTENFDSYTAGTSDARTPSTYPNDPLPQCWQFLNRSNDNRYPQVFISTFQDYIVSGNCLFFKSSSTTPLYAILPEFAQPVANLQVTFTYRNEGTNIDNGTLHVGYLTDPSDASTFVSTLECRKTTTLTTMTAYFPHAPEQGRMAFMYKNGYGSPFYLSIDDVEVSLAPSCLHTGKPSCGELSSQTAKLSWDLIDATQTAWEVQYSTSQDFAGFQTVIANTHENFELLNLEPETQYYARVRARCSDEAFSAWSETITFTTFSTCPVPFNLAVSNITQVSAVLSWSGTIDVQSYDVRYKSTAASSWRTIQDITATTAVLSNLNTYTQYEAQVKSNCSNPEAWSASVVFETGYSGIVPSDLQVSDITATGATFTWNGEETESFQYCAVTNPQEGFDPTDWINVQGNTVRLENAFTPNRPARFYLRKYFGYQAVSRYAYVDFHTDCGSMVLSFDGDNDFYFEDFESYEGNSCIGNENKFSGTLPRCWDGYFTSQYEQPEVIAGWTPHIINNGDEYCYYHHSGTNSLFFFGREYGYAALPYFANPISTLRISFWMKRDSGGTLVLGYIKSGDVNYNTFTPIAEFEDSYFSMVQHSKDLNEVPAEATRLVFRWFAEGASYECCIDDVKVSLLPTCQPPTGLDVGNVTSTGANFTWGAEADETFQYFTISNPPADFEPSRETNWTVVHGNTLNLTNDFAPNTLVRFYLRKGCGDGGYSDYTSVQFRTICDPISLVNYSEDFDSYTGVSSGSYPHDTYPFDPLPDCWRFLTRPEESDDNPQVFISSNSSYANSWNNCLFFRSSTTTPIYAVLPEFEENISGYQLTFVYRQEGTSEFNGTLYVGYMTDPDDTSTFVQTLACPKTTAFITTTAYFTDAPQGSYMVFKYAGGTHDNYFLSIDDVVVGVAPSCFPTGKPTCGELSAHTAQLSWDLVDPTQTDWEVEYSKNPDFSGSTVIPATTHADFELTDLDEETTYYVRVRANCGETNSEPSQTLTFTTLSICPVPTDLAANNLTQESAKINWTSSIDVESYAVCYQRTQQVVGIDERFNTASLPEGWESKKGLLSDIMAGGAFGSSDQRSWIFGANGYGVDEMSAYLVVNGTDHNDWLITKRHTVTPSDAFSFYLSISSTDQSNSQITNGPDDRFVVLITADDGRTWNVLREWNNSGSADVYINISPYEFQQESIDLSGYVGQTVRIAFYGESTVSNASNCLHLDNVVFGTSMAASEPQTQTGITGNQENAANSVVIQGLVANTEYEVQVKSECSDPEVWSAPITFRTLDPYMKVFVGGDVSADDTEGNQWGNSNNWVPAGVPTINQGVELQANATIPSGYVAEANQIEGDYGLTIEDGGQLKTNNTARVMVKKVITGYGAGNEADKAGYYLIANPLDANIMSSALTSTNMLTGNYDLYNWDNSQEVEWRNYEENGFDMASGLYGYLYANEATTELSFTGSVRSNVNANLSRNVYDYSDQYEFGGWWLLGNPYVCNAYLSSASANGTALPYIKMNGDGDGFTNVAAGTPIEPMEGFFYQTDATKDVYVVTTAPAVQSGSKLNMNLRRDNKQLDNAILVFGGDQKLGKMTFRANSSKIYMPVEGKDYAITTVEGQVGEMPVSFKAEKNGTYSLSFTSEEVTFSYLHLIDNMTGADVNLLQTPSYTFTAKTTDYASRFRLVFATGSSANDETFGFVNASGNFCIFGIEGEATVQVIDVLGHVVSSETFSGSYEMKIGGAPGVYMVRLINGNDVKVQKVVVQ